MLLPTALFALVGLILGLLGSGGSIVALPVLVYAAGFPAREAVAGSLVVVGAVSLVGAYLRYRRGEHHLKATLLLGSSGMVGAYFGSGLTSLVSPRVLMLIFAGVMLAVGVMMLAGKDESAPGDRCYPLRCALIGVVVGALTGFLGVGGGFLIVPALILLAGIEAKQAIAASLGIICLNSGAGLVGHLGQVSLEWRTLGIFLVVAMAGMAAGAALANRASSSGLRRAFAWSLVALALVIGGVNAFALGVAETMQG